MTDMEVGADMVLVVAIEVNTPLVGVIRKVVIFPDFSFPAKRNAPVTSRARKIGPVPAGNGEPLIVVGTPVLGSMLKAYTLFPFRLATYRYLPEESVITELSGFTTVETMTP